MSAKTRYRLDYTTCPECGERANSSVLDERMWHCPYCGHDWERSQESEKQ